MLSNNTIVLYISNQKKTYTLLKEIYNTSILKIKELNGTPIQKIEALKDLIKNIEVISEINLEYLLLLKNLRKSIPNSSEFNYKKEFNLLKYSLTNSAIEKLKETQIFKVSPILEIKNILSDKINGINNVYTILNIHFNFPLIYGIERLRQFVYRDYVILNLYSNETIKCFKEYINIMDKDKDITNYSLDNYDFCPKIYLFILIITEMLSYANKGAIQQFFIKNTELDTKSILDIKMNNLKFYRISNEYYYIENGYEKLEILEKDYILETLLSELILHSNYPLKLLLIRNQSYAQHIKNGRFKGFLEQLGLYDSFIDYIKFFLQSKSIKELMESDDKFENILALISNKNYLDEIFSEKHFMFLPFFQIEKYFGFTNKDLIISVINSIPDIVYGINLKDENDYQDIFPICLLFIITEKFITSLHEVVIHLTTGYLSYISENLLSQVSPKTKKFNDGGYYFESKLLGNGKSFNEIKLNHIIALLDGVTCKKGYKELKDALNDPLNIDELIQRNKDNQLEGFIGEFKKKFNVNFNYFKKEDNENSLHISFRKTEEMKVLLSGNVISSRPRNIPI